MITRLSTLALFAVVLVACAGPAQTGSPAPSADPMAEATRQVNRFFDLLKSRDVAALSNFLSPAFQLQRSDGSGATKLDYVAIEPADITSYQITNLRASQAGDVLITRYLAEVVGTVNGAPYTPGPAPRLSVFVWNGSDWQLVAHSNFNPLSG